MDTDNNPKADVKKWSLTSSKTSMVIGSVAILAVCLLAGLVFTRYEAGILPTEAAATSAQNQFIRMTISEQNLLPSGASGALGRHTPSVVGGVCSAEGPLTS